MPKKVEVEIKHIKLHVDIPVVHQHYFWITLQLFKIIRSEHTKK